MGENKHIEELDAFAKKYIQEQKVEQPSANFTANIMQSVLRTENVALYKATPLISKKVWGALAAVLIGAIVLVARGSSVQWLQVPELNLEALSKIQVPNIFETLTVSKTMLYACFFFTLMIFVQIYFLKGHFAKKIEE